MSTGPHDAEPTQPYGAVPPPPPPPPLFGGAQPPPPAYPAPPPTYAMPGAAVWGVSPAAPYGVHPTTGIPYSDKSKLAAGLLQILIPLGIGRFYIGDTKTGVWQLVVTIFTCGLGSLWPFIDGIILLATDSKDVNGYMLRS